MLPYGMGPLEDDVREMVDEQAKGKRVIPDPEHVGIDKVEDELGVSDTSSEAPPADDEAIETDAKEPDEPETQFGESTSVTGKPLPPEE